MAKQYFVYILASKRNGTLYVGMTNDLAKRIEQHKSGLGSAFTKRYAIHLLAHVESYGTQANALQREKNIKAWRRAWKLELIEKTNPNWEDLTETLHV
jgi:putative endonuclease